MPPLNIHRSRYTVASVGDCIYVFGGYTADFDPIDVDERYNPISNTWDTIPPMQRMYFTEVVTMNGRIYVIGGLREEEDLINFFKMVQVFNPESNSWYVVDAPNVIGDEFKAVVYRGRLYVIVDVELDEADKHIALEYSPEDDSWEFLPNLPFTYFIPKAIELEDRLIVFENRLQTRSALNNIKAHPPVFWDTYEKRWVAIEKSSSLFNVNFYQFCKISQPSIVKNVMRQNRLSGADWVKSPFA